MDAVNPIYIPRNHNVEIALQAAIQENNLEPFKKLFSVMQNPYKEISGMEEYSNPIKGSDSSYKTFCGT